MNEELISELTSNQSRLQSYIFSLTANREATRDILQATNLVIWEKAADFVPGTNFIAWAFTIARFQVSAFRSKQSRDRLVFSDAFVNELADTMDKNLSDDRFTARQRALAACLGEVTTHHRRFLALKYHNGMRMKDIASEIGKTTTAVEKSLSRLRKSLLHCIERRLAAEARG